MSAYQREVEKAREIALAAADLVRSYAGRKVRVDSKAGNEPVTEADHAANALIVERLRAAFPDDAILSEELPDDGSRQGAERVWMVDPIDGTSDFILGDTGYAVMIGLLIGGRPTVGVVSQPTTRKTYSGVVGEGAWLDTVDGRTPLTTSTLSGPPGIRLVASKTHRTPRVDAVKRALGITDEINIGSVGLKIGLVAEKARDLYVYTGGRTKIWDTCGPEAILVAAGGRVTDLDGQPLAYATTDLYNRRGIVASNGPLHDHVIAVIAPHVQTKTD
ncbi:MAG TPA: 3'(2'),5'-bisphosphate nucleotidase CysQ [Polyangia bacterium]|nr:3'(2'),5'-bisphosphate nucleotidase CysQ [Polyangia bacterium]